jgi:hypothetical protein
MCTWHVEQCPGCDGWFCVEYKECRTRCKEENAHAPPYLPDEDFAPIFGSGNSKDTTTQKSIKDYYPIVKSEERKD